MACATSPSFPLKDSSLFPAPPAGHAPIAGTAAVPDAGAARNSQGHFLQPFKLAAVRYAASSGKSQRAAAKNLGIVIDIVAIRPGEIVGIQATSTGECFSPS